ncbi:FG-GAP-like repeat-containing protein [Streptomyces sp. t99]|uniref:FG-GAP-like repeat-containing protein n=1 Tax=Streptomyces sp. t99 TaxID=1828172 RepID=UPI000996E1E3|nr:FG-GAP-like repeat-containing protein [Streptomyces sp. t99]
MRIRRSMAVTATAIAISAGASTPLAAAAGEAPADTGIPFAVEDGAYPYRADILELAGADLIAGDGNITYTPCSEPHQIKVWARNLTTNENRICFVAADTGYLSVNIPRAFRIETYDRDLKANVSIDGTTENLTVPRDTAKGFGEANPADPKQAVLLEMRVTGTGTPATPPPAGDTTHAFTGKLRIGETRSCTAVLVDPRWAVTAKSCFADKPSESIDTAVGAPKQKTTITLGRADLNSTGTHTSTISHVIPRPDRDLALVQLDEPATGIVPVTISGTAPAANEKLTIAGYGRTVDEWAPTKLHTSDFSVGATTATAVDLTAKTPEDAVICKGDAGAPALRTENGKPTLVAIGSQSHQGGCLGETDVEARTDAVGVRADDLTGWVSQIRKLPQGPQVASGDFNGDGKVDIAAFYDNGIGADGKKMSSLYAFYSNGTGFAEPKKIWASTGSFTGSAAKLTSGDYNGDGKDDLSVLYNSGQAADGKHVTTVFTYTSNGTGFVAPKQTWASSGSFDWSKSKPVSGDYNGDGKDDLAVVYNGGQANDGKHVTILFRFASTGSAFSNPTTAWTSSGSFDWSKSKPVSGDFNGDGKDDLAVFYNGGQANDGKHVSLAFTFASSGSAFNNPTTAWTSTGSFNWEKSKPVPGDFNGDGKDDLSVLYDSGQAADGKHVSTLFAFTSNGTGFTSPKETWASSGSFNWNVILPTSGDYNKDGKDDLGVLYEGRTTVDAKRLDSLFTFTSTATGTKAPVLQWTGSTD